MVNRQRRERPPQRTRTEITAEDYPKKIFVFEVGRERNGGSISKVAKQLGTTENNVVMHIQQCLSRCGYGYAYEGDWYEITG